MSVIDLAQRRKIENRVVEEALPAHLMFLMVEECRKIGFVLRADVAQKLNNAAILPLTALEKNQISRTATRVDELAKALLHNLSPDDPRHGLYCCAMFTLLMVDEGYLQDKTAMAVLVALMLMDDVKDATPDVDGAGVVWYERDREWRKAAGAMHQRAALQGYYSALT